MGKAILQVKWSYIYLVLLEENDAAGKKQNNGGDDTIQGFKQAWVDWMPQVIKNGLFIL